VFGIKAAVLRKVPVSLPPLSEQHAIASVLSSLDDKIDLLHLQNKTLEAMAETLFRQWFVEEADEEWEDKFLSSVAEHKKYNIKPQQNHTTIYHHYSIPAFDDKKQPINELGSEIKSNKYKVIPNSILISKLNPRFPRVWAISDLSDEYSICSTEFQVVYPIKKIYYEFVYYLLKSKKTTEELIAAAGGTSGSHQRVKPKDIFNLSFKMPPYDKICEFNIVVSANLNKISANQKQICTLEKLRDTLLPKLMSGEVRVELAQGENG
jgi:type I restriction enzyme S subunit